jgi:hypothetical protein
MTVEHDIYTSPHNVYDIVEDENSIPLLEQVHVPEQENAYFAAVHTNAWQVCASSIN